MKKIALITGASSGLGLEYALQLDKISKKNRLPKVDEIWLIARREDRLRELAGKLDAETRVFAGDICHDSFRLSIVESIKNEEKQISYLINSAGMGKTGYFEDLTHKEVEGLLDLNIKALTLLCHETLPFMSRGGIIFNIASVAAFLPQVNFSIYAASKSYVLSFSRALSFELADKGIKVIAVCPNPMETEFFDKSPEKQVSAIKKIGLESPKRVVSYSLKLAANNFIKRRVSVSHFFAKIIHLLSKILPSSFVMWCEKKIGI